MLLLKQSNHLLVVPEQTKSIIYCAPRGEVQSKEILHNVQHNPVMPNPVELL